MRTSSGGNSTTPRSHSVRRPGGVRYVPPSAHRTAGRKRETTLAGGIHDAAHASGGPIRGAVVNLNGGSGSGTATATLTPMATQTSTDHLSAVARGGALSLVGAVVSAAANLILTVVITHGVHRAAAGEFFALTSVFLLAEVFCRLGSDVGLIYFLARWRTLGRFDDMRTGMRVALRPPMILSSVVGVAMFVGADWISHWLGGGASGVWLMRLLAFILPIAVFYDVCVAATRGWARMRPTVFIEKIGRPVGQLAFVAAAIGLGWKSGIGVGWALPYVASAVAVVVAIRTMPWHAVRPAGMTQPGRPQTAVSREFWRFTAPRAIAAVAQLLLQRMDIVLVAALRGPVEAAIYTAATRFLVVGQFVNMALVAPMQPRLSSLLATKNIEGTRELYQTTTSWLVLFVWPMYLSIAVLAPSYLHIFGSGYSSGLWVVILLCMAMLFASSVGFVDVVLLMVGRSQWNMATSVGALAVDAVLDVILIPHIGIVGAAIGWFGALIASNLIPALLVVRLLGIHAFSAATFTSIVVTTTCFAIIPLAAGYFARGQSGVLMGTGIGLGVYALALWQLRDRLLLNLAAEAIGRRKT